jgi:DNA-binding CsgD family transcriptional regulator
VSALLERDRELERIDALLERARGGDGAVLALEGPPGIGKTRLLEVAAERAHGLIVARAAGSELEQEFGYGVARQLLEPLLDGPLDGAAELAAPAFGMPGASAADRYGVIHGLYWLTANLAAEQPLLLLVDDLQWVDPPSQRFLAYLARRLEGLPAGLMAAVRPPIPGEDRALVDAVAGEALRPSPLSLDAVKALAQAKHGSADRAAECHRATGGNPLWVHAVLDHGRLEPVARDVLRRVGALGPEAVELAHAVAVLGPHATLEAAAVLAGLEPEDAARAVTALTAADVFASDAAPRFRHPVVRAAIYDALAPAELALAHGRAARLLAERAAPAVEVAAHVRMAPPAGDAWAVARLRDAAREARAQGVPELAAALLERALAEPPPDRARVLHELASAELAAGQPGAVERMREAFAALVDPRERAAAAVELSSTLHVRMQPGVALDLLSRAREGLADAELDLTLETLIAAHARMDLATAGDAVERLQRRVAGLAGETPAERFAMAGAAMFAPARTAAQHARGAELIERVVATERLPPGLSESGIVSNLIRAARLDGAEAAIARRLEQARAVGQLSRIGILLLMRGWCALERGRLESAEADFGSSLELAAELELPVAPIAAMLALTIAERGRLDEAAALLHEHHLEGELSEHQVMNPVLFFRARTRLALGRREDGLADLLEVGRRYERWGTVRAVPHWRSLAAVELGDEALARKEVELAEVWGTPLSIGLAQRGLGLVRRDPELLAQAVDTLAGSPARLEHARTLVDLGAALRRAGRRVDSREPLRAGMDAAHALGAAPLADRARDELRATGARPRKLQLSGVQALTASERRVCELAARGLTNRGIAQELFVTVATVETHLRHAFQKLDVRSRTELAEKFRVTTDANGR